jgi:hypothetical protein
MYLAEVIVLNDRPVIRVRSVTPRGSFLVGYFASVDAINDQGARSRRACSSNARICRWAGVSAPGDCG